MGGKEVGREGGRGKGGDRGRGREVRRRYGKKKVVGEGGEVLILEG